MTQNLKSTHLALEDTFQFKDDEFLFSDEAEAGAESESGSEIFNNLNDGHSVWNVIIIDDEPAVHKATRLALRSFTFEGKPLVFLSAYSAEEGKKLLAEKHLEAAFVLLDVVMETHDAGLQVVQYIREHLNNHQLRIILRTGQPGEAPEESVILDYDINDYKLKVELTRKKLLTTVITTLRSYRDIVMIEEQRQELTQTLEDLEQAQQQLQEYSYNLELKVSERTAALEKANQQLHRLAMLDGLTQVANRRSFDDYLRKQWSLLGPQMQPLSLVMIDVDYFKLYNDCYGHLAGDQCLHQVAQAMSKTLARPLDFVARYGGEEFAIALPFTDLQGASIGAQKIISAVKALQLPHSPSPINDWVTISVGVSSMVPLPELSLETLIKTADQAMYQAKQAGRNQYCTYSINADL